MKDVQLFGIPVTELLILALALLGAGVATGILAGLFGVGGGAVIVPALYAVFGLIGVPDSVKTQLCIGTSLAIIIPTSIQSFRAHSSKGAVDRDILKLWVVPVLFGVFLGGVVAKFAEPALFKLVFIFVATASALRLLFGKGLKFGTELPGERITRAYGVVIGFLSALMGIGGGQLGSMYMSFFNRPIHQAVATSSGLGIMIAIPGAISYMIVGWPKMAILPPLSVGYVSFMGVLLIAPVSALVAPFGASIAHRFNKRQLEISFGIFLLLVAGNFLYGLLVR